MTADVVDIFSTDFASQITRGAQLLNRGHAVITPTETFYGAAGRLDLPEARTRLDAFRTAAGKPFTPHVAQPVDALAYLDDVPAPGRLLMQKLWPGPVSLAFEVSAKRRTDVATSLGVAENLLFDSGMITLRCPDHPLTTALLTAAGGPVAMVRAESGGDWNDLAQRQGENVSLILDGGPTRYSKPSTLVHVTAEGWHVARPGVWDERIIRKRLMTTILFVCSGNTCRSPMSEALGRKVLAEKLGTTQAELEDKSVQVISAGTFAFPGGRPAPQAVSAMTQLGASLDGFRSQPLSVELIHQADRIYTMSAAHRASVLGLVPGAASRVELLDPEGDVEDPIGADSAHYLELARRLETLIRRRLEDVQIGGVGKADGTDVGGTE